MTLPDSLPLPRLFDLIGNKVPELRGLTAKATELERKVGAQSYSLLAAEKPQLSAQASFQVFDLPATFAADLTADLEIHGPDDEVALFEPDPELDKLAASPKITAAAGTSFADLCLRGSVEGGAGAKVPVKALTLSARAAAAKTVRYRHLRPVAAEVRRFDAFRELLASSQLPQKVLDQTPDLVPQEAHVLEAWLRLDFGLAAAAGGEKLLSRMVELFDDTAAELKAHARFSFEASLGWSLYDAMQLAVGSFDVANPGWVRVRLQRRRRRELTLGAKLDLQVSYDLGTSALENLLERIFDLVPTPRLLDALRELDRLFTEGGAAAVKQRLSARAVAVVTDFIETEGWIDKLTADEDVRKLIDRSREIVQAYDELDAKVRDFWNTFLASARLGPGSQARRALQRVADLRGRSVEQVIDELVGGELNRALELIEAFGGEDLEGLVVGDPEAAQAALDQASRLAGQAVAFLDRVPDDFLARLRSFAARTGIAGTVAFLRRNLSSPDALRSALEQAVDQRVGGLVRRVTGKLLERIDDQDVARLAAWADKVLAAFDRMDEIEGDIRNALARLKGEVGFSFGIEISRVSERSAVVDLEIDPSVKKLREALDEALGSGDAEALIQALPDMAVGEDGEDAPPPFRLREAIFLSRRVRTGAFSSFISLFGETTRRTSRIDAETVNLRQVDGGQLRRFGTYRGGLTRTLLAEGSKATANGTDLGVWWRATASGPDGSPAARYTKVESRSLRLGFCRRDHKTLPEERRAIDAMLADLGFLEEESDPKASSLPGAAVNTQLSVDLRFDAAALDEVLRREDDDEGWNRDFLNAARRTFADRLVTTEFQGARLGAVLAALVEEPFFNDNWTDSTGFLSRGLNKPWKVEIDGRQVQDRWVLPAGGQTIIRLPALSEVIFNRRGAFQRLQKAAKSHHELGARPLPEDLRTAARLFANAMGKALQKQWDLPVSPLWLVLARLSRLAPQGLLTVRGIAVLRWKPTGAEDWNDPLVWRLRHGLPAHDHDSIFPF